MIPWKNPQPRSLCCVLAPRLDFLWEHLGILATGVQYQGTIERRFRDKAITVAQSKIRSQRGQRDLKQLFMLKYPCWCASEATDALDKFWVGKPVQRLPT